MKCYAQVRQLAERLGLNPSVCEFESHSRQSSIVCAFGRTTKLGAGPSPAAAGIVRRSRLGRQLADHFGLEPASEPAERSARKKGERGSL